jgi:hypothetical protein
MLSGYESRCASFLNNRTTLVLFHVLLAITFFVSFGVQVSPVFEIKFRPDVVVYSYRYKRDVNGTMTYDGEIVTKRVLEAPASILSYIFNLAAGVDHLWQAFWLLWKISSHRPDIDRVNGARWLEYGLSATCMNILIAISVNILDFMWLLMIAAATAHMMFLGFMIEGETDPDTRKAHKLFAWAEFAFVWVLIITNFSLSVEANGSVPDFVWAIVFLLFTLESLFGVMQQMTESLSTDQLYIREYAYCMASIVAKMSLSWLVFIGYTARN